MTDLNKLKVVIADSHEIVREGIGSRILEHCHAEIVGQAEDGYSTLKVCRHEKPDLLLMDLSLIRPSGMDTFLKLRQTEPDLKILILSSDAISTNAYAVLSNGAVGYIPKQAKGRDFVAAVNAIALGYSCFPCEYVSQFADLRSRVKKSGNIYGLSPREIEVLMACCEGNKSAQVADMLSISVRTVETHRNSIYKKTECRDLDKLSRIVENL